MGALTGRDSLSAAWHNAQVSDAWDVEKIIHQVLQLTPFSQGQEELISLRPLAARAAK
jgi:hypothetical protein